MKSRQNWRNYRKMKEMTKLKLRRRWRLKMARHSLWTRARKMTMKYSMKFKKALYYYQ